MHGEVRVRVSGVYAVNAGAVQLSGAVALPLSEIFSAQTLQLPASDRSFRLVQGKMPGLAPVEQ